MHNERAAGGILEYIRSSGPTQLFDEILSVLRCRAARAYKMLGVTWTRIEGSVRSQNQSLNQTAIRMLGDGSSDEETEIALAETQRIGACPTTRNQQLATR